MICLVRIDQIDSFFFALFNSHPPPTVSANWSPEQFIVATSAVQWIEQNCYSISYFSFFMTVPDELLKIRSNYTLAINNK